ncbi:hypothetical protein [Nonomuraea basaltis]|uniref:hypothetical protein n=1 Tax=Nonomuraea basaltis TaxID=2495887 RepID=UPI00110C633C|nr:hypothetical protein [Nonomuraea basaltis]TMR90540.1 hypothetical protein EJK15_54845 [Nonomuraea basaltis]
MSPAKPAHEQPGATPALVPYDVYGGIIPDPTKADPDSIDWQSPTPFTLPLRLHNTHALHGITRPVLWKHAHGPAQFPMFPAELPHTIRSAVIDHGLVGAEWVPLLRRGQYGIALKSFHEQEEPAPAPAPATPAEEAAARYIDREHVVRLVHVAFGVGLPDEHLPPVLQNLIRHIREDPNP